MIIQKSTGEMNIGTLEAFTLHLHTYIIMSTYISIIENFK